MPCRADDVAGVDDVIRQHQRAVVIAAVHQLLRVGLRLGGGFCHSSVLFSDHSTQVKQLHSRHQHQHRRIQRSLAHTAQQPRQPHDAGGHQHVVHRVEHPPAGAEDAAEFHQPLRQGDIQQFHIVKADDIGNGEQRHKRHAQNKYKIAAQQLRQRGAACLAAHSQHHCRRAQHAQQCQHAKAQIIETVILPVQLRPGGQNPGPGVPALGAGVEQRV